MAIMQLLYITHSLICRLKSLLLKLGRKKQFPKIDFNCIMFGYSYDENCIGRFSFSRKLADTVPKHGFCPNVDSNK